MPSGLLRHSASETSRTAVRPGEVDAQGGTTTGKRGGVAGHPRWSCRRHWSWSRGWPTTERPKLTWRGLGPGRQRAGCYTPPPASRVACEPPLRYGSRSAFGRPLTPAPGMRQGAVNEATQGRRFEAKRRGDAGRLFEGSGRCWSPLSGVGGAGPDLGRPAGGGETATLGPAGACEHGEGGVDAGGGQVAGEEVS